MFVHKTNNRISLLLSIACLFIAFAAAGAGQPPDIQAAHVETPPQIDGQLEDPCWEQASRLEGFCCLEVDRPAPEETIGLICVDDKAIYVAVICRDRTPEAIVANETRRNGEVDEDDHIGFRLDPWHKHGEYDSYIFYVNSLGTQAEEIPGGSATKIEWRGDWSAAACRTPDGWQVEMAIPFSILRYPPGQETFGFAITRQFIKQDIQICYPDVGRAFDPARTANLIGLQPPSAEQRTILMPYVTADFGEYVGRRYDAGLDIQHKLPNGLTVLASLNPDFKQIEDVVEPISFSYTERYLDDPRPFFVTGQWGFLPGTDLLYSRRIEDFDVGLKVFGKVGNESIGLLDAITFGEENSLAAAWDHRFDDKSTAKLSIVSHTRQGEPRSLSHGLGGSHTWRLPEGFNMLWWGYSQSEEDEGPTGGFYYFGGERYRSPGKFQCWGEFRMVTEDFNPALGYSPEVNYRGVSLGFGRMDRPEEGPMEEVGWYVSSDYWPYLEGDGIYHSRLSPSYKWETRDGRRLRIAFTDGRRENTDSSDGSISYSWNRKDMYREGSLYLLKGNRLGGDYTYCSLDQGFRPGERLSVHLGLEYSHLTAPAPDAGESYLAVLTGSYDLTKEKSIAARFIQRRAGLSGYASYRQVVRKGMDVYIILGDPDPDKTGFTERLVVKLIWVM
jgi:hypothetical protein